MLGRDVVILTLDQARTLATYYEQLLGQHKAGPTAWHAANMEASKVFAALTDAVRQAEAQ